MELLNGVEKSNNLIPVTRVYKHTASLLTTVLLSGGFGYYLRFKTVNLSLSCLTLVVLT
jgi:hypothetical protein